METFDIIYYILSMVVICYLFIGNYLMKKDLVGYDFYRRYREECMDPMLFELIKEQEHHFHFLGEVLVAMIKDRNLEITETEKDTLKRLFKASFILYLTRRKLEDSNSKDEVGFYLKSMNTWNMDNQKLLECFNIDEVIDQSTTEEMISMLQYSSKLRQSQQKNKS